MVWKHGEECQKVQRQNDFFSLSCAAWAVSPYLSAVFPLLQFIYKLSAPSPGLWFIWLWFIVLLTLSHSAMTLQECNSNWLESCPSVPMIKPRNICLAPQACDPLEAPSALYLTPALYHWMIYVWKFTWPCCCENQKLTNFPIKG